MSHLDPKQAKQQEDSFRWLQSLSKPREKRYQGYQGAGFLLGVLYFSCSALFDYLGVSRKEWPGMVLYLGCIVAGVFIWSVMVWRAGKWPSVIRQTIFFGVGLGFWSIVLWFTRSERFFWLGFGLLLGFLGIFFGDWLLHRKWSPSTPDV